MEKLTPEEKLLKAIFDESRDDIEELLDEDCAEDEDYDDNYPDTNLEKIGYALYAVTKSLEYISPAIARLNRLQTLLRVSTEENKMPDVITNNEARMALNHLMRVSGNVEDAFSEVSDVYNRTKGDNK